MIKKCDLFDELMEGFDALAQRTGKRTLRTHVMKAKPAPQITPRELAKVPVCKILAYECANARELGAGTGQAKRSSRVADSHGAAVPGQCAPTCGDLKSPKHLFFKAIYRHKSMWEFCGNKPCFSLLSRDKCNRCPASSVS
jgi:hypothetical protein